MKLSFLSSNIGQFSVYLYTDEHVVIPRYSTGVYGSVMRTISDLGQKNHELSYHGKFYIRKDKLMAIDKIGLGQRCISDGVGERIGRCLVRALEEKFNCTTYQLLANKSKEFCSKSSGQLGKFNKAKEDYFKASEVDLVKQTGCLPSCKRYKTSLEDTPDTKTFPAYKNHQMITLVFQYEDGSYNLEEEYVVYDMSNFIADVGGYLGLLLGHSILSIYYLSSDWLSKIKIGRYGTAGQNVS